VLEEKVDTTITSNNDNDDDNENENNIVKPRVLGYWVVVRKWPFLIITTLVVSLFFIQCRVSSVVCRFVVFIYSSLLS